jgi:hypothetical protein
VAFYRLSAISWPFQGPADGTGLLPNMPPTTLGVRVRLVQCGITVFRGLESLLHHTLDKTKTRGGRLMTSSFFPRRRQPVIAAYRKGLVSSVNTSKTSNQVRELAYPSQTEYRNLGNSGTIIYLQEMYGKSCPARARETPSLQKRAVMLSRITLR